MNKRALVIGSQLPPLAGVDNDAAAMTELLRDRGFTVDTRTGEKASRAGILAGYEGLIEEVDSGGAAVFYYAGHGGYALNTNPRPGERTRLQCIFPFDWTETGEFRAILDVELSVLLARLTRKTTNATVILDCCHSSSLSRGPLDPVVQPGQRVLVPRVYGSAWARGVPEFLARNPVDLKGVDVESNPDAVRVVATAPDCRAFETEVLVGKTRVARGLFTSTLERVLAETGKAPLTWQTIGYRLRELVNADTREQVPAIEGPSDRLLFTTQVMKRPDAVVFYYDGDKPFLRANRILGANVGAVYDIMPLGVAEPDAPPIARAKVVELVGANARVELEAIAAGQTRSSGAPPKPDTGALAFPTTLPYPPVPISVTGSTAPRLRNLVRNIRSSLTRDRIEIVDAPSSGRFAIVADGTTLSMYEGDVLAGTELADDDRGGNLLIDRLVRWSKAEAVRALVTDELEQDAIELAWGRVERGQVVAHARDERMHVGEHIYVTVKNRLDRALYLAIFDIGIAGKVSLLTAASPNGRKLEPSESYTLGNRDGESAVRGLGPMVWPDDVPQTWDRPESIVVIAASDWTDFKRLETPALPTRSAARAGRNRLETILDSFRDAQTRDIPAVLPQLEGFCVHRIDFALSAKPRAGAAQSP